MSQLSPQDEFMALLDGCQRDLLAYVLTLVNDKNDALDILQETARALWARFAEYDRQRPFGAWARRFAYIEVLRHRTDRHRHSQRVITLSDGALDQLAEEYDCHSEVLEAQREALQECMRKLRPGDLQLVRQRYWDDQNIRALAAAEGKSQSQAYSQLHRIRGQLLKCIEATLAREESR